MIESEKIFRNDVKKQAKSSLQMSEIYKHVLFSAKTFVEVTNCNYFSLSFASFRDSKLAFTREKAKSLGFALYINNKERGCTEFVKLHRT